MSTAKSANKSKSTSTITARRKKTFMLTTMVLPGALWLLLIRYLPMFGIVLAFKDYKVYPKNPTLIQNVLHSKWVGLSKFKFIVASGNAWVMIRNTLGYNIIFIALGLFFGVTFAILLNEITNKFVAKTYQTLMFFPYFMSWVVASYFLYAFLAPTNGLIPNLQRASGIPLDQIIDWYNYKRPWPLILIMSRLWKGTGYGCVLYLSAITGIDSSLYEAASIDGATKWQQIKYVTLPHLKTMIVILIIMDVGKIFNADFGLFYNIPMNSGLLTPVTQVIDTYVYQALIATNDLSMSSAAGLTQNVLGFICILTANTIARKIDADSSLF